MKNAEELIESTANEILNLYTNKGWKKGDITVVDILKIFGEQYASIKAKETAIGFACFETFEGKIPTHGIFVEMMEDFVGNTYVEFIESGYLKKFKKLYNEWYTKYKEG